MRNALFQISPSLDAQLREALKMTDDVAYFNVTHDSDGLSILDETGAPLPGRLPPGGPFGAALAISVGDKLQIVGTPRGNNVVGTGIASAHAEDQALQPDNYRVLVEELALFKAAGLEATVWMISSGQSCTTCHSKQEIMARDLMQRGLIEEGRFATLYGATYDDTFRVAQFYDAQYADAMIHFARNPRDSANLIRTQQTDYAQAPQDVQKILSAAKGPTAVVVCDGKAYSVGTEGRTDFDLYATPEVSAVRAACTRYHNEITPENPEGVFESWKIGGDLYTTSSEIGPLLFGEMGWTKINRVHCVTMPEKLRHKPFDVRETPALRNAEFLNIVAGGYRDERAAIIVARDKSFVNRAQPMFARVLTANKKALYNGDAVAAAVMLAERDQRTRFLFAAVDLSRLGAEPQNPQPLASLQDFMPSFR